MKKTYESPRVESKGDIRAMTQGRLGPGSYDTGWLAFFQS